MGNDMSAPTLTLRVVVLLGVVGLGSGACASSSPQSAKFAAQHYGDITLSNCGPDRFDNTLIDTSGTITNTLQVPYEYSFFVSVNEGNNVVAGGALSEGPVEPGRVLHWSNKFNIVGALGGGYTCQLHNITGMVSQP